MKKILALVLSSFCLLGCASSNQVVCTLEGDSNSNEFTIYKNGDLIEKIDITIPISEFDENPDPGTLDMMCSFYTAGGGDCQTVTNGDEVSLVISATSKDELFTMFFENVIGDNGEVNYNEGIKELENSGYTCK